MSQPNFHICFDIAYYSVDNAYLYKRVMIVTSTDNNQFLFHEREGNRQLTRKAMTVGSKSIKVIKHILRTREHEVQTYRLCIGITNYTKRYSKIALKDCCELAIDTNHILYSLLKNSIATVVEEIRSVNLNTKFNKDVTNDHESSQARGERYNIQK